MVQILIEAPAVARRVAWLAGMVARDYAEASPVFVGVLNGAVQFMMDLIGRLPPELRQRLRYDFLSASSYRGETSTGEVAIRHAGSLDLAGQDVIVVDGIVDTGLTLARVLELLSKAGPRSLRTCVLLDKPSRRRRPVPVDYCGFAIEDRFVVGYGLDRDQQLRALPFVGVVAR